MDVKLNRGADVLILAMAFPPETLSGSKRPFRMAKYLPGCGYPTHVITACRESRTLGWPNVYIAPGTNPAASVVRASQLLEKLQRLLQNGPAGLLAEPAKMVKSFFFDLDGLVDSTFGRAPRRHWVSTFVLEGVHHGAEIGVIRDLYRLSGQ